LLADRVRSKLGHFARHPNGIEVEARKGQVTLTGWALPEELDAIQKEVMRVPGVRYVICRVQHASPAWSGPAKS